MPASDACFLVLLGRGFGSILKRPHLNHLSQIDQPAGNFLPAEELNEYMQLRLVILAFSLLAWISARAQASGVVIHKAKPTISEHSFDPDNPPGEMPLRVPGEAGLTHSEYTTQIAVAGESQAIGPGRVRFVVKAIAIELALPISVWVENNTPHAVIDHENGHVAISEYYYANIDSYSRRSAQHLLGKGFTGEGSDLQSAQNDATRKVIQQIEAEILNETRDRAAACNDRYDRMTDYGRNPGSQADAAVEAEGSDPEPSLGRRRAAM